MYKNSTDNRYTSITDINLQLFETLGRLNFQKHIPPWVVFHPTSRDYGCKVYFSVHTSTQYILTSHPTQRFKEIHRHHAKHRSRSPNSNPTTLTYCRPLRHITHIKVHHRSTDKMSSFLCKFGTNRVLPNFCFFGAILLAEKNR